MRSLFILMLVAAVGCAVLRAMIARDGALGMLVVGLGVFCYGGIIALPTYAFVGSLMVLTTRSLWGQRAGEIFAAAVGAAVWIGFFLVTLSNWPQVSFVFSAIVLGIIVWLARLNWRTPEGPSPEATLARLSIAKQNCPHRVAPDQWPDCGKQ